LHAYTARRYKPDEIQPFHSSFIRTAAARSLPIVDDFDYLEGGAGVGCAPVSSSPNGIRINGAFAYLDAHREGGTLIVLADSLVERVLFRGDRVEGISLIRGKARLIYPAKQVILSTGAYGSPEILLRSGIRPESDFGV
jgi:choline dehydrogenase